MTVPCNIHELSTLCEQALEAAGYAGQTSSRVRTMPDRRTIRYYTTLGLLDPPAEMRGRTAYYGRRHVLQITAIKRLQSAGASLAELQRQLPGATDAQLTAWAGLPEGFWENLTSGASGDVSKPPAPEPTREDFWQQAAALPMQAPESSAGNAASQSGIVIRLTPGIALTIEGDAAQNFTPEKLNALAPLLNNLAEQLRDA